MILGYLGILSAAVAGGMRVEGSSEQEDGQVDNRLYGLQVRTDIPSCKVAAQDFNARKNANGFTDIQKTYKNTYRTHIKTERYPYLLTQRKKDKKESR